MIEDGESGYLVQPRDPEALARRIIDMARDHRRMREMGGKAFLRFAENFGPDVYARQFEQLYAELVGTEPQRETSGEEILWNSLLALYDSCSGKDIELRQREDSIRNLENELEVYRSQVQRLLHSHSWKVTKPLRYLASLVRGDGSAAEE
jgi:hypothetical protein